ncbi:actin-related protein 2/3 complex subunit 5-C [Photinus pyralis]|uniref:Actin-related protein 2/3 complex subunit 5 n=1 Tax=Photinus pyralis TaxID=7054 RepID=A0A1Y1LRR7_PHOPY|nr:actin-related protein 2/3 complex subunit 5-C [Photinus pyralis]
MAKNTFSSAFRKIDVDQYNEDNFKEDEGDQSGPTGPNENEIITLLNQGKNAEALRAVLSNAPLGSKNQQIKDQALNITLRVLLSIKGSQIDEIVQSLDPELIDVLMKYVYRGFEIPAEGSSGHLLMWHEKAYSVGGVGCIVRVLSDSKRA